MLTALCFVLLFLYPFNLLVYALSSAPGNMFVGWIRADGIGWWLPRLVNRHDEIFGMLFSFVFYFLVGALVGMVVGKCKGESQKIFLKRVKKVERVKSVRKPMRKWLKYGLVSCLVFVGLMILSFGFAFVFQFWEYAIVFMGPVLIAYGWLPYILYEITGWPLILQTGFVPMPTWLGFFVVTFIWFLVFFGLGVLIWWVKKGIRKEKP